MSIINWILFDQERDKQRYRTMRSHNQKFSKQKKTSI